MVVPSRCGGRGGPYPPPRRAFRRRQSFRRISEGNGKHRANRHCLVVPPAAQSGDGDQGGYRPRGPATSPGSGSAASTRGPSAPASLRRRLGVSQMALARLMGVSAPAVAHWEAGESTPTGRNRVTLVALRKVRKREVKELLARRVKETASRASHSRRRRPKRPRRR